MEGGGDVASVPLARKPSDLLPQPTSLELQFLDLVYQGSVQNLLDWLLKNQVETNYCAECVNYRGQTALELATLGQHAAMVRFLLQLGVGPRAVGCALLRAAQSGNIELVNTLLDNSTGQRDAAFPARHCGDFSDDLTPLKLAAQNDHYEIIQILLSRGHHINKPHSAVCDCSKCQQTSKLLQNMSLAESTSRLNSYRAVSSPSYISQTAADPIATAFDQRQELLEWAEYEPEFKDEYTRLAKQNTDFAVSLLGLCRSTQEVMLVIDRPTDRDASSNSERFGRVAMALKYDIKDFVAHPNCQKVLSAEWLDHWQGLRVTRFRQQFLSLLLRILFLPLFAIFHWILPFTDSARTFEAPMTKYLTSLAGHIDFLCVLAVQNYLDESMMVEKLRRGAPDTGLEPFIVLWVFGHWLRTIKNLWMYGYEAYSRHAWNFYDDVMLSFFSLTFLCWGAAAIGVRLFDEVELPQEDWKMYDPRLIGDIFYGVAAMLAIVRLLFYLQISSNIGPLQVSLARLLSDLWPFMSVMCLMMSGFAMALWIIYRRYNGMSNHQYPDHPSGIVTTVSQSEAWRSFGKAMVTLFWTLYGMEPSSNADVILPEKVRQSENGTTEAVYPSHRITELSGYFLYCLYGLACVGMMYNMLIAVMSTTFSLVEENADVEWKFARTKALMMFFTDGNILPPPYNLFPNPATLWHLTRWKRGLTELPGHEPRCTPYRCCYFRKSAATIDQEEEAYQLLIGQLIQRYFIVVHDSSTGTGSMTNIVVGGSNRLTQNKDSKNDDKK